MRKSRLEGWIRDLRKYVGRLGCLAWGIFLKTKFKDILQRMYRLKQKCLAIEIEKLKQKIVAKTNKVDKLRDQAQF